MCAECTIVEC